MSLEEISKAAENERAKNNRPKKVKFTQEKVYQPISPESWKIYSQIYPYSIHFRFFIFIILSLATFFSIYLSTKSDWALYSLLSVLGLLVIRILLHYSIKIILFSSYKTWRKNLGFPVNGWDFLGSVKEYPKVFEWDKNVTVKINFKESALNEERKLMHDALYLLTVKANKCFYHIEGIQSGYAGDIRMKWNINDKMTCSGSADADVLGEIYLSLKNHFKKIHQKYNCIDSVDITFSKKFFRAEPPSTSID